jgi:hypothetical protein
MLSVAETPIQVTLGTRSSKIVDENRRLHSEPPSMSEIDMLQYLALLMNDLYGQVEGGRGVAG